MLAMACRQGGNRGRVSVSPSPLDNAEHCRNRARELRDLAGQMSSEDAREQLLRMAEDYEQLGRSAVQRSEKRRFG